MAWRSPCQPRSELSQENLGVSSQYKQRPARVRAGACDCPGNHRPRTDRQPSQLKFASGSLQPSLELARADDLLPKGDQATSVHPSEPGRLYTSIALSRPDSSARINASATPARTEGSSAHSFREKGERR